MESGSCSSASSNYTIPIFSTLNSQFEKLLPGMHHSPMTMALYETKSSIFEKLLDPPLDAPPQAQVLTRTPSQSRMSVVYNFSTDYMLREQYRDAWNEVRIGKLLEDLDALAGTISIKHCSDDDSATRPLHLVTASVEKIVLRKAIGVDADLRIEGAVTWAGHSSINVHLHLTQTCSPSAETTNPPPDSTALTANFIIVARDCDTGKAAPVNRILPQTQPEKLLYEAAEATSKVRKRKLLERQILIENRFQALLLLADDDEGEGRMLCGRGMSICLENSLVCQPQRRNIHGQIFGGFVMHRAFELAFSTAYAFAGTTPSFVEADRLDFLKPVDVGDLLRFKSRVLYTEAEKSDRPLIHIQVIALVTRPQLRSSEISNSLYFTFTLGAEAKERKNGDRIRRVAPATEEEEEAPELICSNWLPFVLVSKYMYMQILFHHCFS